MATANSNRVIGDQVYTKVIGYDAAGNAISGTDGASRTRGIAVAGSVTFTRPADTTAYTALDVIGGVSSAIHEVALGVPAGAEVQLDTFELIVNRTTVPSGMTSVTVHLYTAAPTAIADNAAFSAAVADRGLYAGSVLMSPIAAVGGGFLYSFADYAGRKIKLTTSSIFAVLLTTTGFTPLSATEHIFRVRGVDLGA